jgi:hypothetical protein
MALFPAFLPCLRRKLRFYPLVIIIDSKMLLCPLSLSLFFFLSPPPPFVLCVGTRIWEGQQKDEVCCRKPKSEPSYLRSCGWGGCQCEGGESATLYPSIVPANALTHTFHTHTLISFPPLPIALFPQPTGTQSLASSAVKRDKSVLAASNFPVKMLSCHTYPPTPTVLPCSIQKDLSACPLPFSYCFLFLLQFLVNFSTLIQLPLPIFLPFFVNKLS